MAGHLPLVTFFSLQFGMLELNRLRVSSGPQFGGLPALQVAQVQDPWQRASSEADLFEFGSFSSPAVSGQLSVDS